MGSMGNKRGTSFYQHGDDRGPPFKKHRQNPQNSPHRNNGAAQDYRGNGYQPQSPGSYLDAKKFKNKENPILSEMTRMPEPYNCQPCKLAATEMQTGMTALLDKMIADELRPDGDKDILQHAAELRNALATRGQKSIPSKPKRELDEKRPPKVKHTPIPAYIERKIKDAKELPPLPPITEPHLEAAVFTHVSSDAHAHVRGALPGSINYERLEFLGDAYIELMASRLLYAHFPQLDVPRQSNLRETLVKNETLSKFSEAYGFSDRLKHGGHFSESKAWIKILADVFEAYVAAVVLSDAENGFRTAEAWLAELWAQPLVAYKEDWIENPRARDDVQQKLLMRGVNLEYRNAKPMVMVDGVQKFFIALYVSGWGYEDELLGRGEGRNKAQACLEAAANALEERNQVFCDCEAKKVEMMAVARREREERGAGKREGKGGAGEGEGEGGAEAERKVGDGEGGGDGERGISKEKEKKDKKKKKKDKKERLDREE